MTLSICALCGANIYPGSGHTCRVYAAIQRGDTYRARALALARRCTHLREWGDDMHDQGSLNADYYERELAAARDHAAISIARAASDGLAKEAAIALLAEAREMMAHDVVCLGDMGRECQCQYAELTASIDALLAARDPQAAQPPEPPLAGS